MSRPRVAVIGGGISGIACARVLHGVDIDVVVYDRGHALGGRMATRTMRETGLPYDGRVVDVGASYLTAKDARFRTVVDDWVARGLGREWTRTFEIDGEAASATGPVRYAAPRGLRSLVEDLAVDLRAVLNPCEVSAVVRTRDGVLVDAERFDVAVLAMPGPQASDLLGYDEPLARLLATERWDPVLALVAAYDERTWTPFDAVFVNDSAVLSFVADDGRRRGDEAPVLVAHSGPVLAARHLDDPRQAIPLMLAALAAVIDDHTAPTWVDVRRWSLARPRTRHDEPFSFDGVLGACGDAWGEAPRVETAWTSGTSLGREIATRLAG